MLGGAASGITRGLSPSGSHPLPGVREPEPYLPLLKLVGLVRLLQGPLSRVPILLPVDGQEDIGIGAGLGLTPCDHLDLVGVGWGHKRHSVEDTWASGWT